ncbi:MAG: hypothetical protein QM757_18690 [Paludibaculum sp.]
MTSVVRAAPESMWSPSRPGSSDHTHGVDVVEHEVAQVGLLFEQSAQGAVAQEVGHFVPMAHGVEALLGQVVGVVGGLAERGGPVHQSGANAVADLLLLVVEHLLGHLLPGEAKVAGGGHEAQADDAAG